VKTADHGAAMRKAVPRKSMLGVSMLGTAAVALMACGTPMRWEKPGVAETLAATDEAECRAAAHQDAIRLYPYGNGPPLYPYSPYRHMSMLQWTQMIDTARYYAEEDLTGSCMRARGYAQVQVLSPARAIDK
jgi:hypothetical protein